VAKKRGAKEGISMFEKVLRDMSREERATFLLKYARLHAMTHYKDENGRWKKRIKSLQCYVKPPRYDRKGRAKDERTNEAN
jgi:hypothetical protein